MDRRARNESERLDGDDTTSDKASLGVPDNYGRVSSFEALQCFR